MDNLPKEIIVNIFLRLPIKFIFRFRCLSKRLCKLIDNPYQARMHIKQFTEDPILILLRPFGPKKRTTSLHIVRRQLLHKSVPVLSTSEVPLMKFDFECSNISLGDCNGLMYFTFKGSSSIILSNPLRGEIVKLPPINSLAATETTFGLGFDSSSNIFKMVCVLDNECTIIHIVGSTSSWRKIPQVPPRPISGRPVFSRGFLYWKANVSGNSKRIVSFDVTNEKFSIIRHPKGSSFELFDMNGNLAMAKFGKELIKIWVKKDYEEKKWVLEFQLPIFKGMKEVTSLSKDGEILIRGIRPRSGQFFIYNLTTKDLKMTQFFQNREPYPAIDGSIPPIYSFTGSLFSLNNLMV